MILGTEIAGFLIPGGNAAKAAKFARYAYLALKSKVYLYDGIAE